MTDLGKFTHLVRVPGDSDERRFVNTDEVDAQAAGAAGWDVIDLREADQLRERCPACTHEWRRHDPQDGKCDAGSDNLGECPCGRDIAFHRVRNAALSVAALAGVQAKEQT